MAGNHAYVPDRRHCVRQKLHAPAFASFDGVTGGMILDLSEEGLSMQTVVPYPSQRQVHLQLDLQDPTEHLETTGYIAWADALGRAGVRFSDLPEESRRRLSDWLTVNATAPSRMAPKFAVGPTDASLRGTNSSAQRVGDHIAITLEADLNVSGQAVNAPLSRTAQYQFNSLSSDLNIATRVIADRARSLTRGTSAAIALRQNNSVICRASVGPGAPALGTRLDVNSGLTGECFRTAKALRCDDTEHDLRVDLDSCRHASIRSILAAPIRYERDVVGLLAVFSSQPFSFDEGDLAIVESLAHTVVVAAKQSSPRRHS